MSSSLAPSVYSAQLNGPQVRVLQEVRILLYRVHLLAGRVPRARTCVAKGSRGGATERNSRHHPLWRGFRGEGRDPRDAECAACVHFPSTPLIRLTILERLSALCQTLQSYVELSCWLSYDDFMD